MKPAVDLSMSRLLAVIAAGLVFLVYLPVALSGYMNHDDYTMLFTDGMYSALVKIGRPCSAEIFFNVLMRIVPFFPSPNFFSILRLINAASLSVSAGLFFIWLNRIAGNRFFALGLTVLFFTLPGFQVFASTAISASHLPVLPLIFAALLVLQRAGDPGGLAVVFSRRYLAYALLAVLLLSISFFTYQATTFLFMACAPVVFLCSPQPLTDRRGAFLQHVAVFAAAGAIHLLVANFVLKPMVDRAESADLHTRQMQVHAPGAVVPFDFHAPSSQATARDVNLHGLTRVQDNLHAFVDFVSRRALNLWIVRDRFGFARCVFALTVLSVLGLLAWIYMQHPSQPVYKRFGIVLEGLVYLAFSLGAANAVQLLYAPTPNYRVLLPYSAFVLFLLAWPCVLVFSRIQRPLLHRLVAGILACGAIGAFAVAQWNTLRLFPDIQNAEYATVRGAIASFLDGQVRTLEFTTRPSGNTFVFGDEFSRLSSYSGRPLYGMVLRAFAEHQGQWNDRLQEQLVITHWDAHGSAGPPRIVNTAAPATAGTLRIDLDDILSPMIVSSTAPVRLAQEGYRGFNILETGRRFYAIPQREGAFDLERLKAGEYSVHFEGRQGLQQIRDQIDAHFASRSGPIP